LTTCQRQFTLELLDSGAEECDLPILCSDDDLEAGIRLDTDLALLSCSNASVLAQSFDPLPQISIVVQVGLTYSGALRYRAEADRPLLDHQFL